MKILKFKFIALSAILATSSIHADEFWGLESWISSLKTPNFEEITDVKERKQAFFNYLLPAISKQNTKIIQLRHNIKTGNINQLKLAQIYKYYRSKEGDIEALLMRVDVVPASLILAQGAYESNWGRSRSGALKKVVVLFHYSAIKKPRMKWPSSHP